MDKKQVGQDGQHSETVRKKYVQGIVPRLEEKSTLTLGNYGAK